MNNDSGNNNVSENNVTNNGTNGNKPNNGNNGNKPNNANANKPNNDKKKPKTLVESAMDYAKVFGIIVLALLFAVLGYRLSKF